MMHWRLLEKAEVAVTGDYRLIALRRIGAVRLAGDVYSDSWNAEEVDAINKTA